MRHDVVRESTAVGSHRSRENNILWIERTLGPAVDILHKPGIIRERSDGNVTLDAAEL